ESKSFRTLKATPPDQAASPKISHSSLEIDLTLIVPAPPGAQNFASKERAIRVPSSPRDRLSASEMCSDIVNSVRHAVALIRANNVAASEGLNPTTPTKLGDGIGMSR
ncbi:hypothetical protein, partial [Bradyrhizobium diazoefficiens]